MSTTVTGYAGFDRQTESTPNMQCPKCGSRVQFVVAEDQHTVHFCVSMACDWERCSSNEEPVVNHNTSEACVRQESAERGVDKRHAR